MKIKLNDLCKRFTSGEQVLENISYQEEFKSLAIIGPSGGGKSTLLRILGGLIMPTSGEVAFDEKTVTYTEKELLQHRRNIGFVFQSKGLFNHLTGKENIMLPLVHVHGYQKKEAEKVAVGLLERFDLGDDGGKFPSELSGGQQQRIAIARAMAIKPRLLLLDEPTSALDPELTSEVLDMVKELQDDGQNIILVTHEMGFAKKACDKIIFLVNGRLMEAGESPSLFSDPQTPELSGFLSKILEWKV